MGGRTHAIAHRVLVAFDLFLGVSAVGGGTALLTNALPGLPTSLLRGSPFRTYTVPAVFIIVGLGGGGLLAAAAELRARHGVGALASFSVGLTLVIFEIVEAASIGIRMRLTPFYAAFGLLQMGLGFFEWMTRPHAPRPAQRQV